jgi:cadmium resistance protein CadD (predicted permease)
VLGAKKRKVGSQGFVLIGLISLAVIVFCSVNIDDLFILMIFFSDPKFRARDTVAGQYLGNFLLYSFSLACSLTALVISKADMGLLGLVPVGMGAQKLYDLWRNPSPTGALPMPYPAGWRSGLGTVAVVTIANGGNNLGICAPLFATRSGYEIAVIGLVFAVMTGVWCFTARWMVKHPALGPPLNRYGHRIVPFVLIGLGFLILVEAGSFEMLAKL